MNIQQVNREFAQKYAIKNVKILKHFKLLLKSVNGAFLFSFYSSSMNMHIYETVKYAQKYAVKIFNYLKYGAHIK